MKFFWCIFGFYLLLLSVQICPDCVENDTDFLPTNDQQTHLNQDEKKQSESRECSPFCICSCRQVSSAIKLNVFTSKNSIAVSTKHAAQIFYQSDYSHQHSNFIWQPPKI